MPIYIAVSKPAPFRYAIEVAPGDIDFMGHVNNASYLKWVQDAVVDHWRNLAPPDAVAQHLWVALKHEITYRRPTFLGDDVIATVLLEKFHGARAFYETVIRRGRKCSPKSNRAGAALMPKPCARRGWRRISSGGFSRKGKGKGPCEIRA